MTAARPRHLPGHAAEETLCASRSQDTNVKTEVCREQIAEEAVGEHGLCCQDSQFLSVQIAGG